MKDETDLYVRIDEYLRANYPRVPYEFDLRGMGFRFHVPRLIDDTQFIGLFVKPVPVGTRLKTKTGKWANKKIQASADYLDDVVNVGYIAQHGVVYEECKSMIDSYLVPAWGPPIQDFPVPAAEEAF